MTTPKPQDHDLKLANALAEFVDLEAQGETVNVEAFCQAHADAGPELRDQLKALKEISDGPSTQANGRPERLSGHKVLDEIGSGGMGRVFLAFDESLGRRVAIKMLANRYWDNAKLRTRFMKEARAMARLSHPNIVPIYNLGQPDEPPHFVMEFIEGVPITHAAKALTLHQRVEIMQKVVRAVDFLHQNHVIHRDLKPGNILVGPDLQPKLLDFGLALHVDEHERLTLPGDLMGTPQYFSPEQARADSPLDARSDVFSLGSVLYEVLTGVLPFRASTLNEQIRTINQDDPVLLRRVNPNVPGNVQNICLKALEKSPADRYATAREMADDLERFLAGEETLAAPTSYSRIMAGKIEQHLRELDGWKQDEILSEAEHQTLRKGYDRLIEREDAWIMQVRRLTLSQVSLYLGAWLMVVATALLMLFSYQNLSSLEKVVVAGLAAAAVGFMGIRRWKQGRFRVAIAELLAFCLLMPIALLVAMGEYGLFAGLTHGKKELEFLLSTLEFDKPTQAQVWWALVFSLPIYAWLRRFTHSSVFSLVLAIATALLSVDTLLRMGMLEWENGDAFLKLIPIALLFYAAGLLIERLRLAADSRYFYPIAVAFTFVALSGVALYRQTYAQWLGAELPWTRLNSDAAQLEYLFIINAGIYLLLQTICEHLPWSQLRSVSRAFRFVIPGHVLIDLLRLGVMAPEHSRQAKTFEIILPCAACVFVFTSVPKQMKNFFVWGMVFLAVGVIQLQRDLLKDDRFWPLGLLMGGLILMLCAANYTTIKISVLRWFQRNR